MKVGSSVALLALGAILAFALKDVIEGVDLALIGFILMGAGVLGLVLSLTLGRTGHRVESTEQISTTPTGDTVAHKETVAN